MIEWHRSFLQVRTGRRSATLRELYPLCPEEERHLSAAWYELCLAGRPTGRLTPFEGIRLGPGPLAVAASGAAASPADDLRALLGSALAESLGKAGEVAVDVAVSGGVDSWLLAALLQSLGYRVRGWYLESGVAEYCELPQVERSSQALGIECRHIRATADDFLNAVPEFVAVTETPIYNLHPVSKWLLAKALRREGVATLVTGDGADQAMRQERDCDLLPLTLTCFQSAGIRVVAPFLAASVALFCRQPDPGKRPVRLLARQLGVPDVPKHPTLFPAVALPPHPRALLPAPAAPSRQYQAQCVSYTTGLLLGMLEDAP